jgi:hypothetical protein
VAVLLLVDQYATLVHASGHRHFSGDIRRVSHLAFGNNYPLYLRQDARALGPKKIATVLAVEAPGRQGVQTWHIWICRVCTNSRSGCIEVQNVTLFSGSRNGAKVHCWVETARPAPSSPDKEPLREWSCPRNSPATDSVCRNHCGSPLK